MAEGALSGSSMVLAVQIAVERIRSASGSERADELRRQAAALTYRMEIERKRSLMRIETALIHAATGDLSVLECNVDDVVQVIRTHMVRGLIKGTEVTGTDSKWWVR